MTAESAPSAYPLAWPAGRPRTSWQKRRRGSFVASEKPITRSAAISRVGREVDQLGGHYLVVSSDLPLRKDGEPHQGKPEPADPGVCIYFVLDRTPYAMACDTFDTIAQNLAAIANHINATRRIARYGVASAAETLQAFQALPAPKRPHEVLGVAPGATAEAVRIAWRARISGAHPDQGGSHASAAELNAARDAMLKGLSQ